MNEDLSKTEMSGYVAAMTPLESKLNEIVEKAKRSLQYGTANYASHNDSVLHLACLAYGEVVKESVTNCQTCGHKMLPTGSGTYYCPVMRCEGNNKSTGEKLGAGDLGEPFNEQDPFYKETMEQADFLKKASHNFYDEDDLHIREGILTAARKLEYFAQCFTLTANHLPLELEVEKLKKELERVKALNFDLRELVNGQEKQEIYLSTELSKLEKELEQSRKETKK
jgi:hypothetical protein